MATTSNPIVVSTNTFPSLSTAAIFTSASSSGTTLTSSTTSYPQASPVAGPLQPSSTRLTTTCSPSNQTLLNLKSLIKRRNRLPPPYASVVRTTATYIPPIETSTVVDYSPLDLSVRPTIAVVPSGPPAAPRLLAPLGVEAKPEPSSSTMPHRIPILQRPQSTLAALLSAGPSTRPTPSSTPVVDVLYPLYTEVKGNKSDTV
jgi:hypothetical protein